MKHLKNIGVVVAVLLILLITFGFTLAELATITKITSSDQAVGLAVMNGGFYIAIKLVVISLAIYVTSLYLYSIYKVFVADNKYKAKRKRLEKAMQAATGKDTPEEAFEEIKKRAYANERVPQEVVDEVFSKPIEFEPKYDVKETSGINVMEVINSYPNRTLFELGEAGDIAWGYAVKEWIDAAPNSILHNLQVMQQYVDRHGKNYGDRSWVKALPSGIKTLYTYGYHNICN